MTKIKHPRTINTGYAELIARDPNTAITRHALRQAVINGEIPSRMVGRTYIYNLEDAYEYFTGGTIDD